MLFKKIVIVALGLLIIGSIVEAGELGNKASEQTLLSANNKIPMEAKQKLAQRMQNKHQEARMRSSVSKTVAKQNVKRPLTQNQPVNLQKAPLNPQLPKSNISIRKVNPDGTPYIEENNLNQKHRKKKKASAKPYEERAFFLDTMLPRNYKEISIFGEAKATKAQAVAYLRNNNPNVKLSCSPEKLVDLYWEEAEREGICPDLTFCQALLETGFFKYGGDVVYKQNNFCGLGTTGGGVRGASFKTPQLGVRAHVQHLLAYSKTVKPKTPIIDPRYYVAHDIRLSKGMITQWSGLNGTWAMGAEYCEKIMYHFVRMQAAKPLSVSNLQPSFKRTSTNKNTSPKLSMRERLARNKSLRK